jgi:hypothetical protein
MVEARTTAVSVLTDVRCFGLVLRDLLLLLATPRYPESTRVVFNR